MDQRDRAGDPRSKGGQRESAPPERVLRAQQAAAGYPAVVGGALRIVRKAVAYITRNGRVLFFRAREATTLGAELPGGTLLPGEDARDGVLREACEETGLSEFGVPRFLGIVNHDPDNGKGEIHERHFFELPLLVDAPATWDRVVEEGNGPFTFSFFWVERASVPAHVYPGHDVFLEEMLPNS